jgi:hypothetical protein
MGIKFTDFAVYEPIFRCGDPKKKALAHAQEAVFLALDCPTTCFRLKA